MLIPIINPARFPALYAALPADSDVRSGASIVADALTTAKRLGVAGDVYIELPRATAPDAAFLPRESLIAVFKPLLRAIRCRVGPFSPSEVDLATSWLDNGAALAVFDLTVHTTESAAAAVADESADAVLQVVEALASSLPASRVAAHIRTHSAGGGAASSSPARASSVPVNVLAAIASLKSHVCGVVVTLDGVTITADIIRTLRSASGSHLSLTVDASASTLTHTDVGRLHRHEMHVQATGVIAASDAEVAAAEADRVLDVGSAFIACARSDRPDGLFTTVVVDECGKALGLVYSNAASVLEALRIGRGVYYSRSRGGLWRKGDTSGAWQALLSVRLDCDSDAMLFTVKQMGTVPAFCHLNTRTCWGEDGGLTALERTLAARKIDAPVGSYTKRLFDDSTLLRNKLLEEAQELSEATDPDHIASEAADLIYFALVACAAAGVTLADVESHLDRRALKVRRRAGDSKPARIAAARAHFAALEAAKAANGGEVAKASAAGEAAVAAPPAP